MIRDKDLLYQCAHRQHRFIVKENDVTDGTSCIECGGYASPIGYAKNFQIDGLRTKETTPSKLRINVNITHTDLFKQISQLLKDVVDDERVPAAVREEIMNKVKAILESEDEC